MENNLIIQENLQPSVRNIDTVTEEILSIKAYAQKTAIACAIELGRRFKEAKSMLPHGEWGVWLEETVDFSQSTVNNYMKIFEEYGSEQISLFGATPLSQSVEKLNYTQAIMLLAIPREEREEFIEQNDVENLSVRELNKLIKERDEAIKKAEEAEQRAKELEAYKDQIEDSEGRIMQAEADKLTAIDELKEAEQKLKDLEESLKKEKQKNKDLKDNPKIPQSKLDEIEKQAQEKAAQDTQKQINELKETIAKANKEKEAAEAQKKEAESKLAKMEAKEKMSNSIVAEFKLNFDRLQNEATSCLTILQKAKETSPEIAEKLQKALDAFIVSISGNK